MHADIPIGTKVRLRGRLISATLRSPYERVIAPDVWDGFVIVRLNEPAIYRLADGSTEDISEIREAADNLIALDS